MKLHLDWVFEDSNQTNVPASNLSRRLTMAERYKAYALIYNPDQISLQNITDPVEAEPKTLVDRVEKALLAAKDYLENPVLTYPLEWEVRETICSKTNTNEDV